MNDITLTYEIIEDITQAKKIWEQLSPKKSLYDEWDIRFCFYEQFKYPLKFFIGKHQNKIVGLLPLQFNEHKKYLEFFGGEYMDENKVFLLPQYEKFLSDFYLRIKENALLDNLYGNHDFIITQGFSNYIYYLNLGVIKDYEMNDKRFFKGSSKHCTQLKKEITNFSKNKINISKNKFSDLEIFFEFKIKQFGRTSCFNNEYERKQFINLFKLNYDFHVFTFSIDMQKIGFSIAILYKGKYMFLEMASDFIKYPDIGKFIVMINIIEASKLKSKILDASRSTGDTWKDRWNFEKTTQYFFKNY